MTSGYCEPSSFTIKYLNGSTWTDVTSASYTPDEPVSNYNEVSFDSVTSNQVRVYMTRKSGFYVGLKEVQVFSSGNAAPAVNAGQDATFLLASGVTLSGTASDDGLPSSSLTTTWSLDSGPGSATIANASSLNTTATVSATGTYVFRLTASDGELSSYDTVTMTVVESNTAPTVSAGSDASYSLSGGVTLSGTAKRRRASFRFADHDMES